MILIGAATVKNEADVIEAFIRHNLQFLDALWILDNGSGDATPRIVETLAAGELPAQLVGRDADLSHRQADKLNALMRIAAQQGADAFFPLDADEFIVAPDRETLEGWLAALPPGACGLLPWRTYVPTLADDWAEPDPRRRLVHRRVEEPVTAKAVLPRALITDPSVSLSEGAHQANRAEGPPPPHYLAPAAALAHLPARSPEQLASKILLGALALASKPERLPGEGAHWDALLRRFAAEGAPDRAELCALARAYHGGSADAALIHDPLPVPDAARLTAPDLTRVDLTQRFAADLVRRLDVTSMRG